MGKYSDGSTFNSTYNFVTGAYYITYFVTFFMLLKILYIESHTTLFILSAGLYLLLFFNFIYIHYKKRDLIVSILVLFWIVTAINVLHFLFLPINEALFLFAFIPILLFITVRNRKLLIINIVLFYTLLIITILFNLRYIKSVLNSDFFIIFSLFNILMIFFGLYYQKTMCRLIKNLEESNKINTFLLRETHHRIKNNLNLLSSILALQIDLNNPKDREFFFTNQQRIESIAKLHEILYKKEALSNTNLREYIEQILLLIQKESAKKIEYKLYITKETLSLDRLIYLGIIVTEIILNSIKYNTNQTIKLTFNFSKGSSYLLKICENVSLDLGYFKKSFGFELLNMATQNLYGSFNLEQNDGKTCYIVDFPIEVDDV